MRASNFYKGFKIQVFALADPQMKEEPRLPWGAMGTVYKKGKRVEVVYTPYGYITIKEAEDWARQWCRDWIDGHPA